MHDYEDEQETVVSLDEALQGTEAREALKGFIGRIENLSEQQKQLAEDVKEVYAEAKSAGFDTKVMRALIKVRQDPAAYEEFEQLLDLYLKAAQ